MPGTAISISGLKELRAALKQLGDAENSNRMKGALMDGADLVAVRARAKVPGKSGKAAGSISARVTTRGAMVVGGGDPPYYGWLEFGTRDPKTGQPRSSGPWKRSGIGPRNGRFIYPTMDECAEQVFDLVVNGLNQVIRDAGL